MSERMVYRVSGDGHERIVEAATMGEAQSLFVKSCLDDFGHDSGWDEPDAVVSCELLSGFPCVRCTGGRGE